MQTAFKEWMVIVEALGRGDQIFILRKGGIHEGRGGFKMEHSEFLLFPTLFHQQKESVLPGHDSGLDQEISDAQARNMIPIEFAAEVVDFHHLENFADVQKLSGQHIWRDEVIEQRFEWGRERGIYAIAIRVARLPIRIEMPNLPDYGGCKSWVTLAKDINTRQAAPVLPDAEFNARLERFRSALA